MILWDDWWVMRMLPLSIYQCTVGTNDDDDVTLINFPMYCGASQGSESGTNALILELNEIWTTVKGNLLMMQPILSVSKAYNLIL